LSVDCVRASNDGVGGIKPARQCTVHLDNQLRITYNWVAPEVLLGEPFSFVSDIYSLCAVFWESVKGAWSKSSALTLFILFYYVKSYTRYINEVKYEYTVR